ncbi:MAG TPA: hypothetical protein VFV10_19045 [Gammaproteobacteria bacterium]|nr:hypothetical protein [Gammaproteobacteria bacterium]
MQGREWVTAGALAGIVGGAFLAVAIARSDDRRAVRVRKRLRREAKRLRKETRRLARETEDWVERARSNARIPERLARSFDGAEELRKSARGALTSGAAAAREAAGGAARGARGLLASAGGSSALDTAYDKARPYVRNMPWLASGALYGALLHAFNADGGRSVLGMIRGNGRSAGARSAAAQRLGVHLLYGTATALAFGLLSEWRRRH